MINTSADFQSRILFRAPLASGYVQNAVPGDSKVRTYVDMNGDGYLNTVEVGGQYRMLSSVVTHRTTEQALNIDFQTLATYARNHRKEVLEGKDLEGKVWLQHLTVKVAASGPLCASRETVVENVHPRSLIAPKLPLDDPKSVEWGIDTHTQEFILYKAAV